MSRARLRPLHLMVLIQAVLCSSVAYGQLPPKLQRCLPYPTFAEEVDMLSQESNQPDNPPQPKVLVVDYVVFDPPTGLSNSPRERALAELKQMDPNVGLDSIGEKVRSAWQGRGYFKVQVTADFRTISGDAARRHVALAIHVDEGPQYSLGRLEVRSSDPHDPLVFSADQLRKLAPLQEGDVFDAEKIRRSLDDMRNLYGSHGYIDLNVNPLFDIDDAHHVIDLTLEVDQQEQFHIGKVEVLGLNLATEKSLRTKIKSGDIFDVDMLKQFFKENRAALPAGASLEDVNLKRNAKTGIVDMTFNFLTCPKLQD